MSDSFLIVLPWSPYLPAGVSVVAKNLRRIWQAEGIATHILISDWETRQPIAFDEHTSKLRLALAAFSRGKTYLPALYAPITLFRTWLLLRQRKVTVVSFHYVGLDALGIAILKRLGLYQGRLILCFHGTDLRQPEDGLRRRLWSFLIKTATNVTACSKSLGHAVETRFDLPAGTVICAYNGVDTSTFSPAAANISCWQDLSPLPGRYIISVGSFIQRKGHRFLVDGFASLAATHPELSLVVVGGDGDEHDALKAYVDQIGLQHRVKFYIGLTPPQVAHALARSTICVQPSLAEPFGMAVIEAGACGVCVAASDVGGHSELIDHDRTGLLFAAADSVAINAALTTLLHQPELCEQLSVRFRADILSLYTWEACAEIYKNAAA